MKRLLRGNIIWLVLSLLLTSCAALKPPEPSVLSSRQALVVTTRAWDRVEGILEGYEKADEGGPWFRVMERVPVVVGRNGMGWGTGLHPLTLPEGPVKREGDGRAPAGIFRLSSIFGYAPAADLAGIRMPYLHATARLLCIDDVRSKHYNRIVDADSVQEDWQGYEQMLRRDDLYRWGIVIDHNMSPVVGGSGSCIFMHIWMGASKGTAGCTALELNKLELLLRWLDPAAMPVLIQMPEAEYERLRGQWNLP
jgi:D-alanyl-D-alanine dipeptidase